MESPEATYFRKKYNLTIIGVEAFHCPVRDGKEWFHPAMASGLKTGQFGIIFLLS